MSGAGKRGRCEPKMYTAQEMRHTAMDIHSHIVTRPSDIVFDSTLCDAVAMLCQGADAEEENAQLKARLEAVVKECEKMRDDFSKRMLSFTGMGASNMKNIYKDKIEVVDDILRTARGEGGAE